MICFRQNPQAEGKLIGHQGRKHAGQQRRVMHDSHADHFHGKDGRRHGRPKHRGESRAHAAHHQYFSVTLIQMEQPSQRIADTSAHLQGRSLSSGGTAEEMRNQRGAKDQRRQIDRHMLFAVMHRRDQKVRSRVLFDAAKPVQPHNEQAARRQQKQKKRKCISYTGHLRKPQREQTAEAARHKTHDKGA